MSTSVAYKAGVIAGIIIGLIVAAFLIRWMRLKGRKERCEFDERQELIRGRGFKYGFYTLLIYMFVYGFLESVIEKTFLDPMVGTFIGCGFGITVWAGYGIWNDAYLALNENVKRVHIVFIVVLVINLAVGVMHIVEGDVIEDGMLSAGTLNLFCSLMLLIILSIMGIKKFHDRSLAEED